jgi:hypothetical protein
MQNREGAARRQTEHGAAAEALAALSLEASAGSSGSIEIAIAGLDQADWKSSVGAVGQRAKRVNDLKSAPCLADLEDVSGL